MDVLIDPLREIASLRDAVDLLDHQGWTGIDLQLLQATQILVRLMNEQRVAEARRQRETS